MPKGIYKHDLLKEKQKRKISETLKKAYSEGKRKIIKNFSHKGFKHSEETKRIIGEKSRGRINKFKRTKGIFKANSGSFKKGTPKELHPRWKGGITELHNQIRHSQKYKEWRLAIFSRDEFKCRNCGINDRTIQAHHIKPFRKILEESQVKNLLEIYNYKEFWDLNNGITLCEECHKKTDNYLNRWQKIREVCFLVDKT